MCLLLTLLAVPVFYSIFEDIQESTVWRRVGGAFIGLGERLKGAFSNLKRKKKNIETDTVQPSKEIYVQQTSSE